MGLTRIRSCFNSDKLAFILFDSELDSFYKYLEITNKAIEDKLKNELAEYKKYKELLGDDDDTLNMMFDDSDINKRQRILRLYYSSILISLYSFLEQSMQRLCQVVEPNKSIKLDDINGNGIFKFKTYLQKVVGINFEPINSEWNEITKFNHLRNHFVHTSNTELLEIESKKRKNSISEIKGIKLVEIPEQKIQVIEFDDDKAIMHFISIVGSFLSKLYHEG